VKEDGVGLVADEVLDCLWWMVAGEAEMDEGLPYVLRRFTSWV
jgi:hypothetical protein